MLQSVVFEPPIAMESDKKPWERQERESARWFMRFRLYLNLGTKRTVNAAYEVEHQVDSKEKQRKSRTKCGPEWYNAARRWQWEERAHAWDKEQDEHKAALMRQIAMRCAFVSRPFRIVELNTMAEALMRAMEKGIAAELYVPLSKQLQSLLRDIAEETALWGVTIDASCDAAALDALKQGGERLKEIAEEREAEEDAALDAQIADLARRGLLEKYKTDRPLTTY